MEEKKGVPAVLLIGGAVAVVAAALFFATLAEAAGAITLTAGWNDVVYTGKEQTAERAFASIIDYLEIVYYWEAETNLWVLVQADTIMVQGEIYWISVTQDCIWTF